MDHQQSSFEYVPPSIYAEEEKMSSLKKRTLRMIELR
jgi:hypothetical protein